MYQDDPKLIQACLAGKQNAWDELVERYGRLIYSIPRKYGFSDADADDVYSSVFTILFRKLNTVRDHTRLAAWIIRTTHRECYRIGKKANRYTELDHLIEDVSEPAPEQLVQWEHQQLVRQGLIQLGGRCQELLTAMFLEPANPNYEAIANRLGMKVGSVGPTRARCFEKLEKILIAIGLEPRTHLSQDQDQSQNDPNKVP